MSNNILFNHTLDEYNKKYRNLRKNLIALSKDQVERVDKEFNDSNFNDGYLLKGRKWWLIGDTYYEIPKAPRLTWFRNLNNGVQALSCFLAVGVLSGAGCGIYYLLNRPDPFKTDIANVETMNKILANEKDGFSYPKLAVDYLKKNNFSIDTSSPLTSDVEYGYNLRNNEVVLIGKDDEQIKYSKSSVTKTSDVWRFKDKYTLSDTSIDETYGTYLRPNSLNKVSNANDDEGTPFNSNLDVGENKDCNLIFKSTISKETPIVATNYGSLTINGSLDSISHYGILNTLKVDSIKGEYNEYGTVYGDVLLNDGTFNAKKDSDINTIILEKSTVKVDVSIDNYRVGSVAATDPSYITAQSVVVPSEKEQKPKEITVAVDPKKKEFEGLGTEDSPYMITEISQTSKITKKYEEETDSYACYIYAGSEQTIDAREWSYSNGKSMHLHGQFNCNGLTINNMDSYLVNKLGKVGDYAADKLNKISNLTINATIARPDACAPIARTAGEYVLLENITVHGYIAAGGASSFVAYGAANLDDTYRDMYLTFKNCYSDASIYVTNLKQGGVSPYFVNAYCNFKTGLTTYEDTIFEGKMIYPDKFKGASKPYCRYFNSSAQGCLKVKTIYSDKFIEKYGNPEGVLYPAPSSKDINECFYAGSYPDSFVLEHMCFDDFKKTEKLSTLHSENKNEINQATSSSSLAVIGTDKVANAVRASASLFISPNNKQGSGSYLASYLSEDIDLTNIAVGAQFTTKEVKNFQVRVNKPGVTEQGIHDYEYDVYDAHKFYYVPSSAAFESGEYSSAHVCIVQYDSNDIPIWVDTFPFKSLQSSI